MLKLKLINNRRMFKTGDIHPYLKNTLKINVVYTLFTSTFEIQNNAALE